MAIGVVSALLAALPVPAATSNGQCLRDAANMDQGNICTAEDVKTSQLNVLGNAPTTCVAGETLNLVLQAVTVCGSQSRYDIGFYIAQDGGDAKSRGSICFRDFLNPASTDNLDLDLNCSIDNDPAVADGPDNCGPYYNAEKGLHDSCGDIQQNLSSLFILNEGAPISFRCTDRDGDGNADIGACVSWDSQAATECSSELDTIPGNSSKCKCNPVPIKPVIAVKGAIFVDQVTVPSPDPSHKSFSFQILGGSVEKPFTLTDADPAYNSGPLDTSVTYKIAEEPEAGWDLTSAVCIGDNRTPEDATDDRTIDPTVIDLKSGEIVRCTFTSTDTFDECDGVVCTAIDQCHVAGECDPATGECTNPTMADGKGCDDGDLCTQTDTCQGGICQGTDIVVCTAKDQCHVAGECDPATGLCASPNAPDGTSCDDSNLCTQTDTCHAGSCIGAEPVLCVAPDQCHTAGTCNPATGACRPQNAADGTGCNDGNPCTQTDVCQAGSCSGTNPVICSAQDQCHVAGTCNPATGVCSNPSANNGTACNDGNLCTQSDSCQGGVCTAGNPVVCTAQDACHVAGTCNPVSGLCSNPNAPNGTLCSDSNACTTGDVCSNGACAGGAPPNCNDGDDCTADACSPQSGCVHQQICNSASIEPSSTSCNDYKNGTGPGLTSLSYTTKGSKINTVSPSAYFYYARINAPSASFALSVSQSHAPAPTPDWKPVKIQAVRLFNANCVTNTVRTVVTTTSGNATIQVSGATAGATYYLSIKYDATNLGGTVINRTLGVFPSVTYTDAMAINGVTIGSSADNVLVKPK